MLWQRWPLTQAVRQVRMRKAPMLSLEKKDSNKGKITPSLSTSCKINGSQRGVMETSAPSLSQRRAASDRPSENHLDCCRRPRWLAKVRRALWVPNKKNRSNHLDWCYAPSTLILKRYINQLWNTRLLKGHYSCEMGVRRVILSQASWLRKTRRCSRCLNLEWCWYKKRKRLQFWAIGAWPKSRCKWRLRRNGLCWPQDLSRSTQSTKKCLMKI